MASKKNETILGRIFQRYCVQALSAMALGLFSSLIIGLILSQLARFEPLSFLEPLTGVLGASSPVVGAIIGVAVGHGLGADPLVMFSAGCCGAIGYAAGGGNGCPVGAFLGAAVGAEIGQLVSKRTPVDIIITPIVTIVAGGLAGNFVGPYVQSFMHWLGALINEATALQPVPMGLVVGAVVGMVLTLPISSAALCIMMGLSGLAAGAATAGCCAQMVGFAVMSFRENGVSGLLSQGIGTSMLQVPNILRHPQIWIAPTVASALGGVVSAALFGMTNNAAGAGMGTSGLVGQFTTLSTMGATPHTFLLIGLVHFLLPAVTALGVNQLLRRVGWVKDGYMKLDV